jgi:hypothetical protein
VKFFSALQIFSEEAEIILSVSEIRLRSRHVLIARTCLHFPGAHAHRPTARAEFSYRDHYFPISNGVCLSVRPLSRPLNCHEHFIFPFCGFELGARSNACCFLQTCEAPVKFPEDVADIRSFSYRFRNMNAFSRISDGNRSRFSYQGLKFSSA